MRGRVFLNSQDWRVKIDVRYHNRGIVASHSIRSSDLRRCCSDGTLGDVMDVRVQLQLQLAGLACVKADSGSRNR